MANISTRSQLLERLGATQRNVVWSWCAVDEEGRKAYLSIWKDLWCKPDGKTMAYVIQEPHWGIDDQTGARTAARNDHDEKLALVFEQGYEAFGYFIEAKDPGAKVREIARTETSFIRGLRVVRQPDGIILGYPTVRIEIR